MSNRLVLVTGGTGYLGSALVPEIAKRYPVRVYCNFAFGNSIEGTPNVEFIKGDITGGSVLSGKLPYLVACSNIFAIFRLSLAERITMTGSISPSQILLPTFTFIFFFLQALLFVQPSACHQAVARSTCNQLVQIVCGNRACCDSDTCDGHNLSKQ